jgi:hypothetical protein
MANIDVYSSKQKIIDSFNNNSVCLQSKFNVSDTECLKEIKQICKEHPRYVHRYIKKDSAETKHLYDFVIQQTAFMDDFQFAPKFCTRLYWLVNDLKDFPRCHHCGKNSILEIYIHLKKDIHIFAHINVNYHRAEDAAACR